MRAIDTFVDGLDLLDLGFGRAVPRETGAPAYYPAGPLKLHICGYLNRVPLSRRLECEASRNVEVMCLMGLLVPVR